MARRFSRIQSALSIAGLLLGAATLAAAEQEAAPSPSPFLKPLAVKWTSSGNPSYFQADKKVGNGKELKAIIDSLNDPVATRLLAQSEVQETWGTAGLVGGMVMIAGGITASSIDTINNGWDGKIDTETAILVFGGLGVDLLSLLVLDESTSSRFASVERYNQVLHKEPGLSLSLPGNASKPGLRLAFQF
jgi:hypothetical protein